MKQIANRKKLNLHDLHKYYKRQWTQHLLRINGTPASKKVYEYFPADINV
jgi:hypothetical protein